MQTLENVEVTFEDLFEFLGVVEKDAIQKVQHDFFIETPDSELTPILGVIQKTNHDIFKYTLENGIEFLVSDKHLVFEFGELKHISSCSSVDTINGTFRVVSSEFVKNGDVFDISIPNPHLYITPNGVVHHNTSMLLQLLELLERNGKRTAYISGEENIEQLAFTAKRLNVVSVPLANITDVDELCEAIVEQECDFVVIDSLPAISSKLKMNKRELEDYITTKIIQTAKENEIVIGTILHFTKSGTYKGSTLLPHSVDCNIVMERNKEDLSLRDIDVTKNRFGSAGQAVFEMTSTGFTFEAVEVDDEASGKKSKRDIVLESIDSTPKTLESIAKDSKVTGTYLANILRELVNEGAVTKEGRGATALYTKK